MAKRDLDRKSDQQGEDEAQTHEVHDHLRTLAFWFEHIIKEAMIERGFRPLDEVADSV